MVYHSYLRILALELALKRIANITQVITTNGQKIARLLLTTLRSLQRDLKGLKPDDVEDEVSEMSIPQPPKGGGKKMVIRAIAPPLPQPYYSSTTTSTTTTTRRKATRTRTTATTTK
eukprot:UN02684